MVKGSMKSFIEYLDAKKVIDDRSLNQHVLSALQSDLAREDSHAQHRTLEVGAGIGTMIERLLERGILKTGDYTLLDIEEPLLQDARRRLDHRFTAYHPEDPSRWGEHLFLRTFKQEVKVHFVAGDIHDHIGSGKEGSSYDLLIAHAFMDLVNIPRTMPGLLKLLRPGGVFYFSLVYDGVTHFEPEIDRSLDERIMETYHQTMDERVLQGRPAGDRYSGRRLLNELLLYDAEIQAAGPSDWLVYPVNGTYPDKHSLFLSHILNIMEGALTDHPGVSTEDLEHWLRSRREQLNEGKLVYLAHQIDVIGRVTG